MLAHSKGLSHTPLLCFALFFSVLRPPTLDQKLLKLRVRPLPVTSYELLTTAVATFLQALSGLFYSFFSRDSATAFLSLPSAP